MEIVESFLRVARWLDERGERSDAEADVQVGLGVMHYLNSEYGRAGDCFRYALGVRPGVRFVLRSCTPVVWRN